MTTHTYVNDSCTVNFRQIPAGATSSVLSNDHCKPYLWQVSTEHFRAKEPGGGGGGGAAGGDKGKDR